MTRLPSLGPRGEGWVILQLVLLGAIALTGLLAVEPPSGTIGSVLSVVGLVLLLGGLALAARGLYDLGRNLTPVPRPREGAALVETGVYALVRHPIYGGVIAVACGWASISASLLTLLLALVLAVFLDLKSRREEAWLADHYDGYGAYMGRTRRFFPYLY